MEVSLLAGLNEAQRAAVTSEAAVLQVLAPPGSGKTKTLTSRVAHLLAHRSYDPRNVICCTFTIKASREMRERLRGLIGEQLESKLILGTFHSICRRYLAAYGNQIGIPKSFGIADSSDSKTMVRKIIKKGGMKIEPNTARNKISWNKARFRSVEVLRQEQAKAKHTNENQQEVIKVYEEYEAELQRNNLLDYDDLLLRCVDLLRAFPLCVANVEALLIDEFQDTNVVQFELMKLFASSRRNVTIVGDPDQSIFGFRAAEIANLKKMRVVFPDTAVINLEENYRSAAAVLYLAQDVIEQDKDRPNKKLKSTHCYGTTPVLRKLPNPHEEGLWIASEVKRTMCMTGALIDHSDIAVLIRSGYLSLLIEKAFTAAGIPYRMVGGMRFFDRAEIRLVVDYLRTIAHPENNSAFLAIINVPSRKIGETAVSSLAALGEEHGLSVWEVVQKVIRGDLKPEKNLSKPSQQDLGKLINIIKRGREKMYGMSPATIPSQLISYLVDCLHLPAYLQQKYKDDYEDRLENIQELIAHANHVASLPDNAESLPVIDGAIQQEVDQRQEALDQFLTNIVLSTEKENDADDKPRVTISTIHSAKGLEWPVVFIPAVYEGSIPHSRAEELDEERRLLYVAITRAQALLNMSFPLYNTRDQQSLDLTQFLPQDLHHRTAEKAPRFSDGVIADIATTLRREMPSQEAIARGVASLTDKQSPEDDLWPLDGRPALGPEQNVMLGNVSFPGKGLSLHEAEQLAKGGKVHANSGFQRASPMGYQTSMSNANSFSTANTSMGMGFTTAGQQMRTVGGVNANAKTSDSQSAKAQLGSQSSAQGIAKGGITRFFQAQSRATPPPTAEAARKAWTNRPSISAPSHTQQRVEPQAQPQPPPAPARAAPTRSHSDIAPQLPVHHFGGVPGAGFGRASAPGRVISSGPGVAAAAGIKRPRPLPLEQVSPNRERRKYVFLSSSPAPEEVDAGTLGQEVDLGDDSDLFEWTGKENEPTKRQKGIGGGQVDGCEDVRKSVSLAGKGRPVVGVVPGASGYPKKSLGVRGVFVPWSERKRK